MDACPQRLENKSCLPETDGQVPKDCCATVFSWTKSKPGEDLGRKEVEVEVGNHKLVLRFV